MHLAPKQSNFRRAVHKNFSTLNTISKIEGTQTKTPSLLSGLPPTRFISQKMKPKQQKKGAQQCAVKSQNVKPTQLTYHQTFA